MKKYLWFIGLVLVTEFIKADKIVVHTDDEEYEYLDSDCGSNCDTLDTPTIEDDAPDVDESTN